MCPHLGNRLAAGMMAMDKIMTVCGNWRLTLAVFSAAALAGCGAPEARFVEYATFAHQREKAAGYEQGFTREQRRDVDNVLAALYGTPDEPKLPANADIIKVLDLSKLKLAAGRVGSDESGRPHGLYRKH